MLLDFLVSKSSGVLKLADFGLARVHISNDPDSLSHQVSTRQYRAPELLFASRHYDTAIDMWGFAVICVELMTLRPLFPGNNDIDQMYRVFQVMGCPTPDRWPVRFMVKFHPCTESCIRVLLSCQTLQK